MEFRQSWASTGSFQHIDGGLTRGQSNPKPSFAKGVSKQKTIIYPHNVQCEQRHPGNCLVVIGEDLGLRGIIC